MIRPELQSAPLTLAQAAKTLGITQATLKAWCEDGRGEPGYPYNITVIKLSGSGKSVRYRLEQPAWLIDAIREALAYYADDAHYMPMGNRASYGRPGGLWARPVLQDGGDCARKVADYTPRIQWEDE